MNFPILLTATVVIQDKSTVIFDSNVRLLQYQIAIEKWISIGVKKIVFCENTCTSIMNENLKHLIESNDVEFEEILFKGSVEKISAKGKGFGEGEIIRYAIEKSDIIKRDQYFFKVTGRLFIKNFLDIKCFIQRENPQGFFLFLKGNKVDTRAFFSDINFYQKNMLFSYVHVDDKAGAFLEHCFYDVLKSIPFRASLGPSPKYAGVSGSTGGSYEMSGIRFFVRDLAMNMLLKKRIY